MNIDSHLPSLRSVPPLDEASKEGHLKWLEYIDPLGYHNLARESRVAKSTGNWFLEGNFNEWKMQDGSFLWLCGKGMCCHHTNLLFANPFYVL
jgi:hypothetical protein